MDIKRAQQILDSEDMIDVTHNGQPVYIESVDSNASKACIHPISEPTNRQDVPLDSLQEQ
ncbi:H-type small acid-soluble spore protein [Clostridium manihotivorum]|uniref:Small, acid-soluble spore protein H n=1 Tax=Clostridium manihotivorum TaxID=2320868 RepID=A0A3R5QUR8_9CLOT|nr:H-type small acid-soluble spore protein [Clostridium manihotivorum]QAA33115.1 H-type small acid-soluble spore protein [Clostridium manihotivorum]